MEGIHLRAAMASTYPEFLILRQFRTAIVRNLHLYQYELTLLDRQLGAQIRDDLASADLERRSLAHSFDNSKSFGTDGSASEQWRLILRQRKLLKEFGEATLLCRQIFRLPAADKGNLLHWRAWLAHKNCGNLDPKSEEAYVWKNTQDLVSLFEQPEDAISRFVNHKLADWWYYALGHRFKKNYLPLYEPSIDEHKILTQGDEISARYLSNAITVLGTVSSSLLPAGSVFALYYIQRPFIRLGAILVFTATFSAIMALITRNRRAEAYAAASAFTAILIEFAGNTPQCSCG